MINNYYKFEQVISIIDNVIKPFYLNKIQEIILEQVWQGKTYAEIANLYNYDAEYVKTKGYELWKLLSKSFGTQISKSNFVPFMRSQINLLNSKLQLAQEINITNIPLAVKEGNVHWSTAPDVINFQGRQLELIQLTKWSQDTGCRSIVISGMVGCGKTTLATKFAKQISDRFDYVIWYSLAEFIPVKYLLKNYLKIFAASVNYSSEDAGDHLSSLLTKFLEYLRTYRCLLVIDDLDSILENNYDNICYRQHSEEYAQLLRCFVATNHQSLTIFTSRIKPKVLEYYASDRLYFINLQGLKQSSIDLIYKNRFQSSLNEIQWQSLSKYCQYNPQILKIFTSKIDRIVEEDFEWVIKEIPSIKEIAELLEEELSHLLITEKEMVYWLAINAPCSKKDLLERRISHFKPRSQLQESLNFLKARGLIDKKDCHYTLQPLIKDYLQKKLIEIGLQN